MSETVPPLPHLSGSEDAAGIETLWKGQEGKQFRKASLHVLRDGDATRDRILRAFEVLRRDVKADDVLLLYLAGHGVASDQIMSDPAMARALQAMGWPDYKSQGLHTGMFLFVPSDFDMRRPMATGLSDDTIYAGPAGDVIWGDYKPSEQPTGQVDHLKGGRGSDWLYASHGTNYITTGAGNDHVLLVYGHGVVRCNGPGHKTIVMPKLPKNRHYQLIGCSDKTIVPFAV